MSGTDKPKQTALPTTEAYLGASSEPVPVPDRLPSAPPGFTIERVLGRGGMGVVYLARQTGLNRHVALKMVRNAVEADPKALIRFLAEAEVVASIQHPNVVQVYSFGEHAGEPYLVLELCPGGSMAEHFAGGVVEPRRAVEFMAQVADGVAAAHAQGIVHRDIKPGNVLLDAAGKAKVMDFGLAKRGAGGDLTQTRAIMGTPAYMSPEQAKGDTRFVGPQADVWALGVMLHELLAGQRPFQAEDSWSLLSKIAHETPRTLKGKVPAELALVVSKCLSKEYHERYQTAAELAADLRNWLAGRPVSARPIGGAARTIKWVRRNKLLAGSLAAAACALLVGTVVSILFALDARAEAKRADGEKRKADDRTNEARELAKAEADAKKVVARQAADARRMLGNLANAEAFKAIDAGDVPLGLLWFMESAFRDPDDPDSVRNARDRFVAYRHGLMPGKLTAVRAAPQQSVEDEFDESHCLVRTKKGIRLHRYAGGETASPPIDAPEGWTIIDEIFEKPPDPAGLVVLRLGREDFPGAAFQAFSLRDGKPAGPLIRREGMDRCQDAKIHGDILIAAFRIQVDNDSTYSIEAWNLRTGKSEGRPYRLNKYGSDWKYFAKGGVLLVPWSYARPENQTYLDAYSFRRGLIPFSGMPRGLGFASLKWGLLYVAERDTKDPNAFTALRCWDIATGREAPFAIRPEVPFKNWHLVGEDHVAIHGTIGRHTLELYRLADGLLDAPVITLPAAPAEITFNRDRTFLAANGADSSQVWRFWDMRTGKQKGESLDLLFRSKEPKWHADGKLLLFYDEANLAMAYADADARAASGKIESADIVQAEFTRDGSGILVTRSNARKGTTVHLAPLDYFLPSRELRHLPEYGRITWRDGQARVQTISLVQAQLEWDLAGGAVELSPFAGQDLFLDPAAKRGYIPTTENPFEMECARSGDGKRLLAWSPQPDGTSLMRLLSAADGAPLGPLLKWPAYVEPLEAGDSGLFAVKTVSTEKNKGDHREEIRFVDSRTGEWLGPALACTGLGAVDRLVFTPKGDAVVLQTILRKSAGQPDHYLSGWDVRTGKPLWPKQACNEFLERRGDALLGPDTKALLDMKTGKPLEAKPPAVDEPRLLDATDDLSTNLWEDATQWIVTGRTAGEILRLRKTDGIPQRAVLGGDGRTVLVGTINGLGFGGLGGFSGTNIPLAFGAESNPPVPGDIRLWNVSEGKPAGPRLAQQRGHMMTEFRVGEDPRRVLLRNVFGRKPVEWQLFDGTTGMPVTPPLPEPPRKELRGEVAAPEEAYQGVPYHDGERLVLRYPSGRLATPPDAGFTLEELRKYAQVLSGREVDGNGDAQFLTGAEWAKRFDDLKAKHPAVFQAGKEERIAWHLSRIPGMAQAHPFAAVFHLRKLVELCPERVDYKEMLRYAERELRPTEVLPVPTR